MNLSSVTPPSLNVKPWIEKPVNVFLPCIMLYMKSIGQRMLWIYIVEVESSLVSLRAQI